MGGPEHNGGGIRAPDVEAVRRRLDLIERFVVQSPKFNPVEDTPTLAGKPGLSSLQANPGGVAWLSLLARSECPEQAVH